MTKKRTFFVDDFHEQRHNAFKAVILAWGVLVDWTHTGRSVFRRGCLMEMIYSLAKNDSCALS